MKRLILLAAVTSLLLTSCGSVSGSVTTENTVKTTTAATEKIFESENYTEPSETGTENEPQTTAGREPVTVIDDADIERLANAKDIFEIKDLLNITSANMSYKECDTDELDYYFDLFRTVPQKFIIAEYEGKKYILFNYVYSGYGVIMDEVTDIEKTYVGNTLDIHVTSVTHNYETMGCAPDVTYCRCILELDQDIDTITIDGNADYSSYTKYNGGILYVGNDRCGAVDGDFNITLPIKYEMIRKYDVYGYKSSDLIAEYYYIFDENGGGLMDKDFNILIDTGYRNITYINDDKFAALLDRDYYGHDSGSKMCLINSKGEILKGPIDGFFDGNFTNNYAHQMVFGIIEQNQMLEGVIDEDFNEIIPPIYEDVELFYEDTPYQFYVVQNKEGKCAVVGTDGELKTDFVYNEIYDCWTDYDEKYIRPREFKD